MKKPYEILHALAGGSRRRRRILTPVGLLIVTGLALAIVYGSLFTDDALALPMLLPGAVGSLIGILLLAAGLLMWSWCIVMFWRARGTPVPFNPPQELVIAGPYARMRNPMTIGVFGCLFGLGFVLHSWSMVALWAPLAFALHAVAVKRLEEPELELRFGERYREYRRQVPMFLPRASRRATKTAARRRE
jgi:protein-S-isoprenylcysteine O-methyltransferase Ste14